MTSLFRSKKKILTNIIFVIVAIIVLAYTISSFYPTFKNDDDISMGLTMHSFINIIKIDSTDVHPPLYYLVLKLFLQITTFWTKSMIIKVLMARILSALFVIGTICILGHTFKFFINNINWKWQIIIYLLVPGMINKLVKIRMYSISSFLLACELCALIKFFRNSRNKYIILATIFSILASYCLYPTAISAGLFILIFFIYGLIYHKSTIYKLFLSGVILLLSYIPWIPVVLNQFIHHSNGDVINNLINLGITKAFLQAITQLIFPTSITSNVFINMFVIVISMIVVFSIIYIIMEVLIKSSVNGLKTIFIITIINWLLTIIITWLVSGINFQPGTIYPIFSILFFFIVYYLISSIYLDRYIILIVLAIFSIYALGGTYYNVKSFDKPSIALVKNYNQWDQTNKRNIKVKTNNALEALQDSVYLESLHKNIKVSGVTKKDLSIDAFDDTNYKPVKVLFNNINIKN